MEAPLQDGSRAGYVERTPVPRTTFARDLQRVYERRGSGVLTRPTTRGKKKFSLVTTTKRDRTMRRSLFTIGALALVFAAGAAEAQAPKLGYINSQEILVNAPGAEAAQAAFDAEMSGYQNEIVQLETELQNLEAALQQQQLTLSPEARANREQQLQAKFQEYQQRTGQLQEVANQRRAALIQPVMDNITAVIEELREEGSYSLILDAAAGSIVSADPALDLTQEVITRLQAAGDPGVGPRE